MMLNPDWLEIIMGYRTTEVEGEVVDIKLPTFKVIHESLFHVRRKEKELRHRAFTEDDLLDLEELLLSSSDLKFRDGYEQRRKELERQIQTATGGKKKIAQAQLDRLDSRMERIDSYWNHLVGYTVDGLSSSVQTHFCFYRSVRYHEEQEPLWQSYEDFLGDDRGVFVKALFDEFVDFSTEFDDTRLRAIAKGGFYRILPQVQDEFGFMTFPDMRDMSIVAVKLMHWLSYYVHSLQNAREECPPEVLDDDDLFDRWIERQKKDLTESASPPPNNSGSSLRKTGGRRNETFIISG